MQYEDTTKGVWTQVWSQSMLASLSEKEAGK